MSHVTWVHNIVKYGAHSKKTKYGIGQFVLDQDSGVSLCALPNTRFVRPFSPTLTSVLMSVATTLC